MERLNLGRVEHEVRVGDLVLSLIHTCELNQAKPFAMLSHTEKAAAHPECWMPWTYRQTLAELPSAASVGQSPSLPSC